VHPFLVFVNLLVTFIQYYRIITVTKNKGSRRPMRYPRHLRLVCAVLVLILLAAPLSVRAEETVTPIPVAGQEATGSADAIDEDPWEDFNRAVFEFNRFFDMVLLRPLAEIYNAAVPDPVQQGVHNFLVNITNPITFINNVLQADGSSSMDTLARLLINTTLGLGGLFDVAAHFGFEDRPTDLGITLGKAGIESGPYLMLPIFGPATVRDALGWGVDFIGDPVNYYLRHSHAVNRHHHHRGKRLVYARSVADMVDRRVNALDFTRKVEETSTDPYVTYRSYYLQHRRSKVVPHEALEADSPAPYKEDEK
jgi:phospholipid-binding lipoprotein MlaA